MSNDEWMAPDEDEPTVVFDVSSAWEETWYCTEWVSYVVLPLPAKVNRWHLTTLG